MSAMSASAPPIVVGLNAVIIALTDGLPRVLTVALPESAPIEGGTVVGGIKHDLPCRAAGKSCYHYTERREMKPWTSDATARLG